MDFIKLKGGSYINVNAVIKWKIIHTDNEKYRLIGYDSHGTEILHSRGYETEKDAIKQLYKYKYDKSNKDLRSEIKELKELIKTLPIVCGIDFLETAKKYPDQFKFDK